MNGVDYYETLNGESAKIFKKTLSGSLVFAGCHDLVVCLNDWYKIIGKYPSSTMIIHAMEALDSSCLQLLHGFYRAGFSSLRLSLEMLMASVYFSSNHLDFIEWKTDGKDISWSRLIEGESGVFSVRFFSAFFHELNNDREIFLGDSKALYRCLSEMVHGNSYTWNSVNPQLEYKQDLIEVYNSYLVSFNKIINFLLCLRFLKEMNDSEREFLHSHILDSVAHVEGIRVYMGGQK